MSKSARPDELQEKNLKHYKGGRLSVVFDYGFVTGATTERPDGIEMDIPDYCSYEEIIYVKNPVNPQRQKMSITFPEAYLHGGSVNGYTADTAPVMFYVLGGAFQGQNIVPVLGRKPAVTAALQRGFVIASANFRGIFDPPVEKNGEKLYFNGSPAQIVDLKAAIRWLRSNAEYLPGDYENMIALGKSSGGAMSALIGASGNTHRFDAELKALGAEEAEDSVKICGDYCGPTDLANADGGYDWYFGRNTYEQSVEYYKNFMGGACQHAEPVMGNTGLPVMKMEPGEKAAQYYSDYARDFVERHIKAELGLSEKEYVTRLMGYLIPAYAKHRAAKPEECSGDYFWFESYEEYLEAGNSEDEFYDAEAYPTDGYINFNLFRACVACRGQKVSPAFDKLEPKDMLGSENCLFGDEKTPAVHFTQLGAGGKVSADITQRVSNQNAADYIGAGDSKIAEHWYFVHGTWDGDIPLTLTFELAEKLKAHGCENVVLDLQEKVTHMCDETIEEAENFLDWCELTYKKVKNLI